MKTTTPTLRLLRAACLCLLCLASSSAFAQNDNDGDGVPDSNPPTRTKNTIAVVSQSATSLEVVFLENTEDLQVEVCDASGTTVAVASGRVSAGSRMQLDTHRWQKGRYTLRVSARGRLQSLSPIQLK